MKDFINQLNAKFDNIFDRLDKIDSRLEKPDCDCLNTQKELEFWRKRYLVDHCIPQTYDAYFLAMPVKYFAKSSPEDHISEIKDFLSKDSKKA
jgi:hypothetical protein